MLNPSYRFPTLYFYFIDILGCITMDLTPNTYPNNEILSSWVWRAFWLSSSNQYLSHTSVASNYPGSNDMYGEIFYSIFNHGLLDDGISPLALLTTSVTRIGLEPEFNNWNTHEHIYNVNSDLGNPENTSTFYATSSVRDGWKYYDVGALGSGGAMMT